MAAFPETLLIAIIAIPFMGSCLAILFPANARNAEAYLAGIVAVIALGSVIATYPHVTNGGIAVAAAAQVEPLPRWPALVRRRRRMPRPAEAPVHADPGSSRARVR